MNACDLGVLGNALRWPTYLIAQSDRICRLAIAEGDAQQPFTKRQKRPIPESKRGGTH